MNRPTNTYSSLATWAILGQQLRALNGQTMASWLPVNRMIGATTPILQANRDEARRLLKASNQVLTPLKDPFETNLGLHRWLNGQREEAYSDWLAWILEQLTTPERIVPLLCGERAGELVNKCVGPLTVHRETVFVTAEGLRRTDIEIVFGQKKAILIEVKMIDADNVTDEQLRYEADYGTDFEERLLLAPSGSPETVSKDFTLLLWRDLCLRLRRLVPSISHENLSAAALVVAFLSAVEQNVLNLPSQHEWYLVTSLTLDHLRRSLEGNIANA
jgi:hypothetical protein